MSGCSTLARWAAPASTHRLDPRIAFMVAVADSGGTTGSSAPASTRVGAWTRPSSAGHVGGGQGVATGGVALGVNAREHRPVTAGHVRPLRQESGREPPAQRRLTRGAVPLAAHLLGSLHPHCGRPEPGRAATHSQPFDTFGMLGRQPHGYQPAERQPGQRARLAPRVSSTLTTLRPSPSTVYGPLGAAAPS